MKHFQLNLSCAAALVILLTACGHHRSAPKPEMIEKAFGLSAPSDASNAALSPSPAAAETTESQQSEAAETRQLAEWAANSIRTQNYTAAVTNLAALQEQRSLTPPQRVAIQRAMEAVQTELALSLRRGDAGAERKAAQLRETFRH